MNLARHAAVVWRFRGVATTGLVLGIVLAVLASYQLSWAGGPSITPRGAEVWTAVSQIQVTQLGFPEGRTTLPTTPEPAAGQPATPKSSEPKVEFGDPGRLAYLADYYSRYMTSAQVLDRVPGKPKASQIQASPFLAAAAGQGLPIIELTANSDSELGSRQLNLGVFEALRSLLEEQQTTNAIADGNRVEVRLFVAPEVTLSSGRSHTMAILALLLCLIGTLAVIHLLEALRDGRAKAATEDQDLATVVPWTAAGPPSFDETQPERLSRPERVSSAGAERKAAAGRRPPT